MCLSWEIQTGRYQVQAGNQPTMETSTAPKVANLVLPTFSTIKTSIRAVLQFLQCFDPLQTPLSAECHILSDGPVAPITLGEIELGIQVFQPRIFYQRPLILDIQSMENISSA